MSKRRHHARRRSKKNHASGGHTNHRSRQIALNCVPDLDQAYRSARALAEAGEYGPARLAYLELAAGKLPQQLEALIENDLGTLDFLSQDAVRARNHFMRALSVDPDFAIPRQNLAIVDAEMHAWRPDLMRPALSDSRTQPSETRVAIISLLFNWPSTGGGTVHTAETGKFLSRAGYDVRHIYAKYASWEVGNVTLPVDIPSQALRFELADWNAAEIQRRFRDAVDWFAPDYVIITDSWNFKPLLAEAVHGYRYFLRLAAQECLCPLNNVRLLVDERGQFSACPRNQLATAEICRQCVSQNQHHSGSLHQAERALSGYGTADYDQRLRRAFADAEGVLAVNPLIAATVSPFAKAVHVVPSGFDTERFPWPWPDGQDNPPKTRTKIFFAGIVDEYMKGFHVLHAACAKLWQTRQDFELVVTSDPPGQVDPMTRFIGWLPQNELPKHLRQADFLVFPTIAEEALGRSAVEAMGVGRPVIASRIGGLPFTVTEGLTGLLFEPGNVDELAAKIEVFLDDSVLRERMGAASRQRFIEQFTWEAIIDTHYRKLLKPIDAEPAPTVRSNGSEQPADVCSDPDGLLLEIAEFFGMVKSEVERMFAMYSSMRERQSQAAGARQSAGLTMAQGFLICLLLSLTRPATIVVAESSPDSADPMQSFHDLKALAGLKCQIIRYDGHEVAVMDDANPAPDLDDDHIATRPTPMFSTTGSFQRDILDRFGSGLIWLAAGAASLSEEVFATTCRHFGQWILAVESDPRHGCDSRDIAAQNTTQGVGFVGVPTDQTNSTHRLKVFARAERLTLIVPKSLAAPVHPL